MQHNELLSKMTSNILKTAGDRQATTTVWVEEGKGEVGGDERGKMRMTV